MDLHTETQILHAFVQEPQWVMEMFGVMVVQQECQNTLALPHSHLCGSLSAVL